MVSLLLVAAVGITVRGAAEEEGAAKPSELAPVPGVPVGDGDGRDYDTRPPLVDGKVPGGETQGGVAGADPSLKDGPGKPPSDAPPPAVIRPGGPEREVVADGTNAPPAVPFPAPAGTGGERPGVFGGLSGARGDAAPAPTAASPELKRGLGDLDLSRWLNPQAAKTGVVAAAAAPKAPAPPEPPPPEAPARDIAPVPAREVPAVAQRSIAPLGGPAEVPARPSKAGAVEKAPLVDNGGASEGIGSKEPAPKEPVLKAAVSQELVSQELVSKEPVSREPLPNDAPPAAPGEEIANSGTGDETAKAAELLKPRLAAPAQEAAPDGAGSALSSVATRVHDALAEPAHAAGEPDAALDLRPRSSVAGLPRMVPIEWLLVAAAIGALALLFNVIAGLMLLFRRARK